MDKGVIPISHQLWGEVLANSRHPSVQQHALTQRNALPQKLWQNPNADIPLLSEVLEDEHGLVAKLPQPLTPELWQFILDNWTAVNTHHVWHSTQRFWEVCLLPALPHRALRQVLTLPKRKATTVANALLGSIYKFGWTPDLRKEDFAPLWDIVTKPEAQVVIATMDGRGLDPVTVVEALVRAKANIATCELTLINQQDNIDALVEIVTATPARQYDPLRKALAHSPYLTQAGASQLIRHGDSDLKIRVRDNRATPYYQPPAGQAPGLEIPIREVQDPEVLEQLVLYGAYRRPWSWALRQNPNLTEQQKWYLGQQFTHTNYPYRVKEPPPGRISPPVALADDLFGTRIEMWETAGSLAPNFKEEQLTEEIVRAVAATYADVTV